MSKASHNEVVLRHALRTYRNALVGFIRRQLTSSFGDQASGELSKLFGKKDEKSGKTRWEIVKEAALSARATPEVSTQVEDDFELLGVADFYVVFEKFFDQLFPDNGSGAANRTEHKSGILRCARQIKVARDPTSHEVTQDIGSDELSLTIANIIILLKACGCEAEAQEQRHLLREQIASKHRLSATVLRAIGKDTAACDDLIRRLRSNDVKIDLQERDDSKPLEATDAPAPTPSGTNIVFVIKSYPLHGAALAKSLEAASRERKNITVVAEQAEADWPAFTGKYGLSPVSRVVYHPEYAAEAADRVAARLLPEPTAPLRSPRAEVAVAVATAFADDRLLPQIISEIQNPSLKRAWFVAPFASDVENWVLSPRRFSQLLAEKTKKGAEITVITRPPSESENSTKKRAFLDQLEKDDVKVLVNPNLHAKIYLFDSQPVRYRWFVGSHNLTGNGLKKLKEVSMGGYRALEFAEAHTAMHKLKSDRYTESYYIWKSRDTKRTYGEGRTS